MNTYTIETVRTVAGLRYYIRTEGKLMRAGFANKTAALERVKLLHLMDKAQEELRGQIKAVRQEHNPA